ncbi:MAG: Mrp/NBP35 family ATP-binding protein [Candidatus Syntropharchaeales archaeon]|nr:Mrp/NBP35 family ATP-binding protein [Candidatus Syntrophoarchaeum sp.]
MADDRLKLMEEQKKVIKERMSDIKHKIAVMSGKGGVGKTTISVNLAMMLAKQGKEVGILDADIHGPNIPKMLGAEDKLPEVGTGKITPVIVPPRIKLMSMAFLLSSKDAPVIWRGPMKMGAIRQFLADVEWGKLDYLIIDLPPGTGDEPLSIAELIQDIDGAIVVTTPQDVALLDSRKAVTFANTLQVPVIGIVENMSGFICPKCGERIDIFKVGGGKNAALDMGVPFLGAVPLEANIVKSSDNGVPVVLDEESEVLKAFEKITTKVEEIVGIK